MNWFNKKEDYYKFLQSLQDYFISQNFNLSQKIAYVENLLIEKFEARDKKYYVDAKLSDISRMLVHSCDNINQTIISMQYLTGTWIDSCEYETEPDHLVVFYPNMRFTWYKWKDKNASIYLESAFKTNPVDLILWNQVIPSFFKTGEINPSSSYLVNKGIQLGTEISKIAGNNTQLKMSPPASSILFKIAMDGIYFGGVEKKEENNQERKSMKLLTYYSTTDRSGSGSYGSKNPYQNMNLVEFIENTEEQKIEFKKDKESEGLDIASVTLKRFS